MRELTKEEKAAIENNIKDLEEKISKLSEQSKLYTGVDGTFFTSIAWKANTELRGLDAEANAQANDAWDAQASLHVEIGKLSTQKTKLEKELYGKSKMAQWVLEQPETLSL